MDFETYLAALGIRPEAEQLSCGVVVSRIKSPPLKIRRLAVDAIALLAPQRAVEVESRYDGRTTRRVMRRGDISLTPPLVEFELRHGALDAVVGWIATPAILRTANAMDPALKGKLGFRIIHKERDMLLSLLAIELSDAFAPDAPARPVYRDALRTVIMGRIIQRYQARSSELQNWGTSREDARIRRTLTYLDRRSTARLDITQIARHVGVSPSHLRQLFRAATGETIFAYVRRRRLQLAAELLNRTRLTVAEIAARCGYASASHFTAAFMAAKKASPGTYRSALHRNADATPADRRGPSGGTRKRTRSR
jgi:AraC-like DNA-binding protein